MATIPTSETIHVERPAHELLTEAEARKLLDETYPGDWARMLVSVCGPGDAGTAPGKRPLGTRWPERARQRVKETADRGVHIAALAKHIAAGGNVGLAIPQDCAALDADDMESFSSLAVRFPDAPTQTSSKGGHIIVRARGTIGNTTRLALGGGIVVDVRSSGGQIVCEPSIHASGAAYCWKIPLPQTLEGLPECPTDLLEKLRRGETQTTPSQNAMAADHTAGGNRYVEGGRNDKLFGDAKRASRTGLDPRELDAALQVRNERLCSPPLPTTEVTKLVESACRGGLLRGGAAEGYESARHLRTQLISFGDIKVQEAGCNLVKGLIQQAKLVVIFGEPGSFKTFAAMEIGHCIASGRPFLGLPVQQGAALYIAAEGGGSVQNRYAALKQSWPETCSSPLWLLPAPVDLLNRCDEVDALIEMIRDLQAETETKIELICIDTYSQSLVGGNENDAGDASTAIHSLNRIRNELDATTIVVAHSGKDASRGIRGSSALHAACDTVFRSERQGQDGEGRDIYQLKCTKQRDLPESDSPPYRTELVEIGRDEEDDPISSLVIASCDQPVRSSKDHGNTKSARVRILEQVIEDELRDPANREIITLEDAKAVGGRVNAGDEKCVLKSVRSAWIARVPEDDPDTKTDTKKDTLRKAFSRTYEAAQAAEIIVVNGDWIAFAKLQER